MQDFCKMRVHYLQWDKVEENKLCKSIFGIQVLSKKRKTTHYNEVHTWWIGPACLNFGELSAII